MGRVKGHSLKGFQHICLVFVGETCILKEELGFKPSTVREVGLFLYNSWQTDPQTLTTRVAGCPHRG